MKKVLSVLLVAVFMVVGILPAAAQGEQTIVEIAAGNDDFETLVTAVTEAGLVETLSGAGPFTVFAPTDDAFAKLPAGTLESALADTDMLTSILTYHVVSGEVLAADVVELNGQQVATVNGESVTITVEGDTVMVNEATVTATDIQASNGVIHVIDSVLLPPSLTAATQAPAQMPTTGAGSFLPLVAAAAGLLLIGGTYVFRARSA
jgi:transforming growth factor-beta-induced protein